MNKLLNQKRRNSANRPAGKPRIFSYSAARNSRDRPLNRGSQAESADSKRSVRQNASKVINYLIALALAFGLLYMCLLNPSAQIKVTGQKIYPRDKSSYEQGVDEQLKSSILYRSKITFDSSKLAAKIKDEFPEVNDVNIGLSPFRHRPVIELSLAKPTARLITRDKTYLLDEEGRVLFDQNDAASNLDTDSFLTINDDSDHQVQLGKSALTQAQIGFIREIIGQTTAKGLKPHSFTLSSGGTALDVRFENLSYYVKFSFASDPRQSSGAFIALQEQLKKDNTQPKQYADLRVPDKAFVK